MHGVLREGFYSVPAKHKGEKVLKLIYEQENSIVKIIKEEIIQEITVEEYEKELKKIIPQDSGLLPLECIYHASEPNKEIYVYEIPGGMETVIFCGLEYTVSMPYRYFFNCLRNGHHDSMWMCVSKEPINSIEDILYLFIIPNIHIDGKFCVGGGLRLQLPITKYNLEIFFKNFKETGFNEDLGRCEDTYFRVHRDNRLNCPPGENLTNYNNYKNIIKTVKNYERTYYSGDPHRNSLFMEIWEELSKKDNLLFKKFVFDKGRDTFKNIIKNLLKGRQVIQ